MNLARSHSRWSCGLKRSGTIWFVVSSVRTWSFIRAAWNRCRWQNLSQRLWFFVFALIDCNHLKTFQCYFFVLFDRSWCLRCVSLCTARPRVAARAPPSAPSDARSARSGPGSASSTADTAHSFESVRRTFSLQKNCFSSWRCVKGDAWWFSAHRLAEELSQEVRCVGGGVSVLLFHWSGRFLKLVFLSYLASGPAICADVWIRYRLWMIWMNTGAVTAAVADAWVSGTRCWTHFLWMSMCGSDVHYEITAVVQ